MYAKDLLETILSFIYYSRIVKNGSTKKQLAVSQATGLLGFLKNSVFNVC